MGKGSKNELSKEVFAALPKDPDQQLEVAQQITQIAVSGRVAKLEADCSSLRQTVAEKDAVIAGLQARVIGAETALAETTAKLAVALEGQARLIEDKNVLAGQVKKLMCQVSKLDEFKKALMKSLETRTECVDDQGDGSNPGSSSSATSRPTPCEIEPPPPISKSTEPPTPTKRKQQGQFSCMTLEKPSPKSPAGTSKSMSPDGDSGASDDGASPKQSPFGPRTPRTPPDNSTAKSARIDGKEFFRQARSRLTYEQFSEFLSNVKALNTHRREKELKAAQCSKFHPKIYSCNTDVPPNGGDWVLASSKVPS